ncbi:sulfotransferase domain-containing protein [Salinibacter ruber]|uniref:sulfotransferase domain-containing protein n=1 Tax=Salinibacter ruber TaxID=146919 RepID=UPI000E57C5FD|nr:sulfotransferase domain-containing protein [Salinibacter ruber]
MSLQNIENKIHSVIYYTLGIAGLRNKDVVLTSFPKSGNTWTRFFLCNLISLNEWNGKMVTFPKLDQTMPELGVSNLLNEWSYDTIPRIVKTHKERWPIFRGNRTILLVRDPRDVMVSYYHAETGRKKGTFDSSFADFIRHPTFGVEAWCEHYTSWCSQATHVMTYEEMKDDDIQAFDRMLKAIGVSLDRTLIEQAAQRSRFENIQKVEDEEGVRESEDFFEDGSRFTRNGKTGQWEEYFSNGDLRLTRSLVNEYDINIYEI